jgi:hypothetical protein
MLLMLLLLLLLPGASEWTCMCWTVPGCLLPCMVSSAAPSGAVACLPAGPDFEQAQRDGCCCGLCGCLLFHCCTRGRVCFTLDRLPQVKKQQSAAAVVVGHCDCCAVMAQETCY